MLTRARDHSLSRRTLEDSGLADLNSRRSRRMFAPMQEIGQEFSEDIFLLNDMRAQAPLA